MITRVGLYNEHFKMSKPEIREVEETQVIKQQSRFNISAGPLVFQGRPLKDTYVLEIDYSVSEKAHRASLGHTFGSHLYADYAETAHNLASKFCKKHGFAINDHLNSWPTFQAVVSKIQN